jgi:hypothetical protein
MYETFIYHPAVSEQYHVGSVLTTEAVQTGACTLCMDDTYSPTCATGRGACSHRGGVKAKNYLVYGSRATTIQQTVIYALATEAYEEKAKKIMLY